MEIRGTRTVLVCELDGFAMPLYAGMSGLATRLAFLLVGFVASAQAAAPAERSMTFLWDAEIPPGAFTLFSGQRVELRFPVTGVAGEVVRLRADPFQATTAMAVPLAPIPSFGLLGAIRAEGPNVVIAHWDAPKIEKPATFLLRISREPVRASNPLVLTIHVVPVSPLRQLDGVSPTWVVGKSVELQPLSEALTAASLRVTRELATGAVIKGILFTCDRVGPAGTANRTVVFTSTLREPYISQVAVFPGGWKVTLPDFLLKNFASNAESQQSLTEAVLAAEKYTRNPP